MKAGFSSFELPSNQNFSLLGYADRGLGNKGINDPVEFNIAYFEIGNEKLIICSGDILAVNIKLTEYIRNTVSVKLDIPKESIMINATHNHSSYSYTRADEKSPLKKIVMDPELSSDEILFFDKMSDMLFEKILEAEDSKTDVNIKYYRSKIHGLGKNRNSKDGYYDDNLHVIKVSGLNDEIKGLIITATCHPTILGSDSYIVSSEFPGYMRKLLKRKFESIGCLFLQGPAGEVSTRFTRQGNDYEEVKRMGELLFNEVNNSLLQEGLSISSLSVHSPEIYFEPRGEIDEDIDERIEKYENSIKNSSDKDLRKLEVALQGAKIHKYFMDNIHFESLRSYLQYIDFGKVKMIGIPGEPFGSLAQEIYKYFGENTIIVGYSNDYVGYILCENDLNKDIYEKEMMVVEKDSESKILEKLKSLKS